MKPIALILTLGLLSSLILTGCAQGNSGGSGPMPVLTGVVTTAVSGVRSTEAAPPTVATAPGGMKVVTLENQGQTISLRVGESFMLKLGEGYFWQVNIGDPTVLERVNNVPLEQGAQGVYRALRVGSINLQATGDPLCLQAQPACGMPSILVEMMVVVQ